MLNSRIHEVNCGTSFQKYLYFEMKVNELKRWTCILLLFKE